jgi:UDP-GlcNAc:undecaprenyl-phosphate GlcNAc-1-phosphate transferase
VPSLLLSDVGRVAAVSFGITAAASPLVLRLLRRSQVVDIPSARSSHAVATPRGGGLACLAGLLVAVAVASPLGAWNKAALLGIVATLAVLGFADDVTDLPVWERLAVQLLVAVGAAWWGLRISWPLSIWVGLALVAGVIWIVAYVNAFNFMDGINGLAGVATTIAGLDLAVVGLVRGDAFIAIGGSAMAGAALAFLPWNYPRARVFLGDVGSYLLGGAAALLVLCGLQAHLPVEALIAPEVIFVADTGWTLAGRVARHEDWKAAHRSHVYQRLQQRHGRHGSTTAAIAAVMAATSGLGLVSLSGVLWARVAADAAIAAVAAAYLLSPRWLRQPQQPVPA